VAGHVIKTLWPVVIIFFAMSVGGAYAQTLGKQIERVLDIHKVIFQEASNINKGMREIKQCNSRLLSGGMCDLNQLNSSRTSIETILATETEMMGLFRSVDQFLYDNPQIKIEKPNFTEINSQLDNVIRLATDRQDEISVFSTLIEVSGFLKQKFDHIDSLDTPTLETAEIREFLNIDENYMDVSFRLYAIVLEFFNSNIKALNNIADSNALEILSEEQRQLANHILKNHYDLINLIAVWNDLLGMPCASCRSPRIGLQYADRVSYSSIESFLTNLERQTSRRWFLPDAIGIEKMASNDKTRLLKKHGTSTGFFICYPGIDKNRYPIIVFDKNKSRQGTIYTSLGPGIIVPVTCSE